MINSWRALSSEVIATYVRVMSIVIAIALIVFGADMVLGVNAAAYDTPVFNAVQRIAPLETWGAGFWAAAFLYVLAAVSMRFFFYTLATLLGTLVQVAWFTAVVWARAFEGAPLTSGAIGLWMLALAATIGTAFSPRQLAGPRPVAVVIDPGDRGELAKAS